MKYAATRRALATDCLIVARHRAKAHAEALGAGPQMAALLAGTEAKAGNAASLHLSGRPARLLVVGGDAAATTAAKFRKDMAAAASALANFKGAHATLCLDDFAVARQDAYRNARVALAAISTATYRFGRYRSKNKPLKLKEVAVQSAEDAAAVRAVRHGQALDAGLALAKDLGNQPPNVCDPAYVAEAAGALAGARVRVSVIDEEQMAELGMGAFLAVTAGTSRPAKLVIVDYRGGAEGAAPIVLIGKGITFDTGGINLKSASGMQDMKFDMCGAASVLGAAKAAIDAELPVNLIAMAAAAENMPGEAATRPSDIVRTLSGKTVEIMNTDAEGRLVLCDALTYARRFKPRAVVDVATLTGAQVVALGAHASALYANNEGLARALARAGETAHDRSWRMPLWEEYQSALDSPFADMKNIGGRPAGSITAACFLARFAKGLKWAHLDVAGTAFTRKGSTGRPTSALFEYLLADAAKA